MLVPMNYVELRRGTSLQQNCCDILIPTAFYARLLFLDRKRSPAKQVLGRASVLTQEKLLKKKKQTTIQHSWRSFVSPDTDDCMRCR